MSAGKRMDGKVALVTGGGTGVGKAIARAFAREGAKVCVLGRRAEHLTNVVDEIDLTGGTARACVGDVTDEAQMAQVLSELHRDYGRLDVLVNNAALYEPKKLIDTTLVEWDATLHANLTAPYRLALLAYSELQRNRGSVLNISSTLALRPVEGNAAYCVSKAALDMLTKVMAVEWSKSGVRANALLLGIVDTPIHNARKVDDPNTFREMAGGMHPIGRIGEPEDVAELALHLSSAEAGWITGSLYTVDGGISLV